MIDALASVAFALHIPLEYADKIPEALKDIIAEFDNGWAEAQPGMLTHLFAEEHWEVLSDLCGNLSRCLVPFTIITHYGKG